MRILLLIALSALDGFLTLKEGGLEIEGNPALRWLMQYDGWIYLFWVHKTIGVGICGYLLNRYKPILLTAALVLFAAIFAIHIVVVSWCDGCVLQ